MCDHGSPTGRSSWDPMLVCLAICGDEKKAGYKYVSGKASVDSRSGENSFIPSENGIHKYVIKVKENDFYKEQINKFITSPGNFFFMTEGI